MCAYGQRMQLRFPDSLICLHGLLPGALTRANSRLPGSDLKIANAGGLGAGSYTVQVTAEDTAGNTNAQTIAVTVVTGPTVVAVSHSYDDTNANNTFGNSSGFISATANSGSITGYGISVGIADTTLAGYTLSKAGNYGTLYVNESTGAYVYVPTSDALLNAQTATVTDVFTITATDGAGTAGNTLTITINGVNDAPSVTTSAGTTAFVEAATIPSTPVVIDGGITVADLDNTTLSAATVRITTNFNSSQDELLFTNDGSTMGNISASYTSGTGVLTLTSVGSTATLQHWIAALSAVKYTNNSHNPSTLERTISFEISDGAASSATLTKTVSVTATNDAPTIDTNNTLTIAEDAAATSIDTYLESSDVDSATITYTITTAPTKATLTNNGTALALNGTFTQVEIDGGKIKYTPSANANGADSFVFTVSDDTDNVTNQTFNITITAVNDAPVISTGDTVSIVEGTTAAFTAAGSDPEGSAITWSISGGADAAKFSINASLGAVTFGTAPSFSTPTDSDTNNSYVVQITASDGTLDVSKTITVTVTQTPVYDDSPSTPATPPQSAVVEVNGEKQDAGQTATETTGGQTTTTITVDETKLNNILEQKGNNATVTLPVSGTPNVVVGQLTGQTVKNMEFKEATLEIKTETVTYTLPASQINIDAVSAQLGSQVELKDIKVNVKIAEPPADTVKIVEDTANKNSYQLVVKPVEFEITCTSGDTTVAVSRFNGYVERTIAIPDGIDPSKITTGIVLNSDGTFSHVPTSIVMIGGKYFAKINSLTNSTYSVIYNPVTFTDVASHWAKDAVNDMGSRMVVTGIGNGIYEPERSITRAEFAAIVVRALGLRQGTTESSFSDVTLTDWFNGYVDTATAYSLITGYNSESFAPNDTITREQAMAILARAMKLTGLSVTLTDSEASALLANYTDAGLVSDYAKAGAAACIKTGVVSGTTASTLSPKDSVTRAEVAAMVQRLLQKSGLI